MTPDSLAMSAALEVPVVAAEIEGERERDNCLGYGGSDVVAVDVLVELQRPYVGIPAIQTAPNVRPMAPRPSTELSAT
jgi:hypothetical protein